MLEVLRCPACGAAESALFDRREMQGFLLCNRMCRRCGLVYLHRRMDDRELECFYRSGYRRLNDGSESPNEQNLAEQRARMLNLVKAARRVVPRVRRHLDIGCSTGILMAGMAKAYGCETAGVEPSVEHRNAARRDGLTVYESIDEAVAREREPFDLITMAHVLEHLPDPAGTLARLRTALLRGGGHVLVEVPNLFGHSCFEPAHLFSFSKKTLHDALRAGGFQPVYTRAHGVPRSAWRPRYVLAIARAAGETAGSRPGHAWGGVRCALLRRRWGLRSSHGLAQMARALGRRLWESGWQARAPAAPGRRSSGDL